MSNDQLQKFKSDHACEHCGKVLMLPVSLACGHNFCFACALVLTDSFYESNCRECKRYYVATSAENVIVNRHYDRFLRDLLMSDEDYLRTCNLITAALLYENGPAACGRKRTGDDRSGACDAHKRFRDHQE